MSAKITRKGSLYLLPREPVAGMKPSKWDSTWMPHSWALLISHPDGRITVRMRQNRDT